MSPKPDPAQRRRGPALIVPDAAKRSMINKAIKPTPDLREEKVAALSIELIVRRTHGDRMRRCARSSQAMPFATSPAGTSRSLSMAAEVYDVCGAHLPQSSPLGVGRLARGLSAPQFTSRCGRRLLLLTLP